MRQELIEKRTRNSKTHYLGKSPEGRDRFAWDGTIGSIHYKDNPQDEAEQWKDIDNAFEPALAPWDWQMLKAGYHIRVKEDFTAGQIIEFEKQGQTVQFQPMALEWTNDLDMIQPISMPHNVVPTITNPEVDLLPAVGMLSHQGSIRWDDGYGEGIDFEWKCTPTRLIKVLEVENLGKLPIPEQYILDGGNPVLRLNLIFDPSKDVDIYVDGEPWDKKAKKQTFNVIQFRKDVEVLWGFMPLTYWDSDGNEGQSAATLEKRGNKLYISIRVPYEWLQGAVYPVFIDVDVDDQVAASEDDCNYRSETEYFSLTATSFWCGSFSATYYDHRAAAFFDSAALPSGATIDVAYVTITCRLLATGTDCRTKCSFEKNQTPSSFSTQADYLGRTKTTAKVDWDFEAIDWDIDVEYNTPPLVTPLQEVADLGALTDIVFFWDDDGSPTDEANRAMGYSYNGSTTKCLKIHIEYTAAPPAYIPRHSGTVGTLMI